MTRQVSIALLATLSGCLWATEKSDVVRGYDARLAFGDDTHGASVHALGGMAGLHVNAEAGMRQFRRAEDPNSYTGGSAGLSVRASPFGIIATDHQLERYFDFGAEAGGEASLIFGVPAGLAGTGAGFVGGWVEIGTMPVGDGYMAITGNLRAMSMADTWRDQVVIAVGLGWRARRVVTADDLRFHD